MIAVIIAEIVLLGIIFGILLLAFNITKELDTDKPQTDLSNSPHKLTTTNGNHYVSTVTGWENVDIESFWDDNTPAEEKIVRWVRGYYDNIFYFTAISYLRFNNENTQVFMRDNSGDLTFTMFKNSSIIPFMNEKLENGTWIKRYKNSQINNNNKNENEYHYESGTAWGIMLY